MPPGASAPAEPTTNHAVVVPPPQLQLHEGMRSDGEIQLHHGRNGFHFAIHHGSPQRFLLRGRRPSLQAP